MRTTLLALLCAVFGLNAATTNRIHSFGVDFYFDADVEWGTFVTTNNIWVVPGAANLTNMTPAASGATNGWEINPQYGSQQGWATNIANYNAALRIAMPLNITSNCTLVKVIGTGNTAQNTTAILRAVALTFLTSAPANPAITFRPLYIGHSKPLYTLADLRTNLVPSYSSSVIPNKQTLSNTVFKFSGGLMMDHMNGSGVSARQVRPSLPKEGVAVSDYQPENNVFFNDAIASILMDDTAAQKQQAQIYLAQWGLDRAYIWEAGYRAPGTGHNPGHRLHAVFGATMFGLTNIIDSCRTNANSHEEEYLYYSTAAGRVLWGQQTATTEHQYWNYAVNAAGSRSHKDPYEFIDGGAGDLPGYLVLNAPTFKSVACIGRMWTNIVSGYPTNTWELLNQFSERWVTNGEWYANDPVKADDGVWANYGVTYGPNGSGSYISGAGRYTTLHGQNLDGGANQSQFIRELWDAYALTGGGSGGTTPPVVQTVACASDGLTWTVNYSQATYIGSGGSGGHSANMSRGAVGLSYVSGSGTATLTFTGTRLVYDGETGTYSYSQPGDGMENITGDDVATTIDQVVANNASAQEPPPDGAARSLVKFKGITITR